MGQTDVSAVNVKGPTPCVLTHRMPEPRFKPPNPKPLNASPNLSASQRQNKWRGQKRPNRPNRLPKTTASTCALELAFSPLFSVDRRCGSAAGFSDLAIGFGPEHVALVVHRAKTTNRRGVSDLPPMAAASGATDAPKSPA